MAINKKQKFNDFGLGNKTKGNRALNKDGSFNIKKKNVPFFEGINFFHSLISMSWLSFIGLIVLSYLLVNIVFASIYTVIGVENLTGIEGLSESDKFFEAFFFSAQTITTLGYGRVAPIGMAANIFAAIESMLGLLAFALATGLLYGRFSKPSAKLKYSTHAVIAPYNDINGFMFRVVNPQNNQLLEVGINVSVSMKRENSDLRNFYAMDLERPKVLFLPAIWTIVHPINDSSPLHKLSKEDLIEKDAEFIVSMKAFDESFSQTVYSRTSYKASEIHWGEKFVYAISQENGETSVDVGMLSESAEAELNP